MSEEWVTFVYGSQYVRTDGNGRYQEEIDVVDEVKRSSYDPLAMAQVSATLFYQALGLDDLEIVFRHHEESGLASLTAVGWRDINPVDPDWQYINEYYRRIGTDWTYEYLK